MKARKHLVGIWIVVALSGLSATGFVAEGATKSRIDVRRGDRFPDLEFEQLIAQESYANLGLQQREGPFSLSQVDADLLVVEFMNKHCVPCQKQVRRVQSLYDELHRQGVFPAVRVLAVAAGNQARYLAKFRDKRQLSYPLAADPKLEQWRRFGEPGRTPLSIFLAREGDGWVLRDYHFGVREEGWLFAETRAVLEGARLPGEADPPSPASVEKTWELDRLGERAAAGELLARVLGHAVQAEPLDLPDGTRLYRAGSGGGPQTVYARLASLEPLCEICHGVHFLYAFDATGTIRGFQGVHVTKWGNEPWSAEDIRFFESRLVGRKASSLEFDEELDAVTRATISSTIIFLEIGEAGQLLEAARRLE